MGIGFLRKEQARRNQLVLIEHIKDEDEGGRTEQTQEENSAPKSIRESTSSGQVDENKPNSSLSSNQTSQLKLQTARKFRKSALPFILLTAIPYMIQLIVFGGLNLYSYSCFRDDVHRAVRLNMLFAHDSHLVAMSMDSTKNPGGSYVRFIVICDCCFQSAHRFCLEEKKMIRLICCLCLLFSIFDVHNTTVYATSMNEVVSTVYDIFNRKFFSLPKLMLLPGMMMKRPMLFVNVFPFILLADKLKATIVASMTSEIERLSKKKKDVRIALCVHSILLFQLTVFYEIVATLIRFACFVSFIASTIPVTSDTK